MADKEVPFVCPDCGHAWSVMVGGTPVVWECGETENSLCHRLLLVHSDGRVEAIGSWEVVHVYD